MERKIIFRGKTIGEAGSSWVYGDLIANQIGDIQIYENAGRHGSIGYYTHFVSPSSVGQFTGLYDKNGDDVYEGDIILSEGNGLFHVEFFDGGFYLMKDDGSIMIHLGGNCESGRIVGNITDNPNFKGIDVRNSITPPRA